MKGCEVAMEIEDTVPMDIIDDLLDLEWIFR